MRKQEEWEDMLAEALDTDYSYRLARSMEQYKTNPKLGYRTAGSDAERETGELLMREMKALGLCDVRRDRIRVDSWEFKKAVIQFTDCSGTRHEFQLGAYQTDFRTDGFEKFTVVYLGKGTAREYDHVDVKGKLVLIDINQRDEWWINFPVYQAHLKGAAALIAVQERGYGEIHSAALNAQDIAGPEEAPAFSMSQADAQIIRTSMKDNEADVFFDAWSQVKLGQEDYNITGCIPGTQGDAKILLSAHYDSYFSGFQDDNAAVSMMLGIARALVQSGYKPSKTLVFCAMAAEEWGVADSKYDWSTGAYEQVFTAHPEWRGQVMADLNFELPAHAHGRKDAVRCTYEYVDFMEEFIRGIKVDEEAYSEGVEVLCPIQTWSDDFSMAIAGIPSMVNDFSGGEFMETHYHSQFDNENFYQEAVYRFHHQLYAKLVLALDRTAAVPLNFEPLFRAVRDSVDMDMCRRTQTDAELLFKGLDRACGLGRELYCKIKKANQDYKRLLELGEEAKADSLACGLSEFNRNLLQIFQKEQDYFVRLSWHDDVLFPQQAVQNNLKAVFGALDCLEQGQVSGALESVYRIDNNRYAFLFDREVYVYFTEYVLNQSADRLKWGAGRIVHHENLFDLVGKLKAKTGGGPADVSEECQMLKKVADRQRLCYKDDIQYMTMSVKKLCRAMEACVKMI